MIGWDTNKILGNQQELFDNLGIKTLGPNPVHKKIYINKDEHVSVLASSFMLSLNEENSYKLIKVEAPQMDDPSIAPLYKEFPRLLQSLTEAVCAVSLNGTILQANTSFYKLLSGNEKMEIENIKDLYVYPEDLEEKVSILMKQGFYSKTGCLFLNCEGLARQFSDTTWLIKDNLGAPTAYICLLKDVSQVKNLESRLKIAERNHEQLFDNMLLSIILVDPQGHILNMNSTARKMYGYSREEVMGELFDKKFLGKKD